MEFPIMLSIFALVVISCVCISKLSIWINMPCLIIFLCVGLLAGSEGIGLIDFNDAKTANYIGSVAMAFILFSGGFDTKWNDIQRVFTCGGILASVGVLITAVFVGLFAYFAFQFFLPEKEVSLSWCFLLGSTVSSTDASAVFSILRSGAVSLKGRIKPLLEFESGSNDPMATFLTVFMLGVVLSEATTGQTTPYLSYLAIIPNFFLKMTLGVVFGIVFGRIATIIFNNINLQYDGLYHVLAIGIAIFTYGVTELCNGNGFMAVYVAGAVMGNSRFVFHNGTGRVYDGIAWLMQVVLFVMLGLLAFPSQLWEVRWIGIFIAIFIMVMARPMMIFLCTVGTKFNVKEKIFISWVGLRAGAPIMLATFPMMSGISGSDVLFHIVFLIVFTSVIIQGVTLMPLARFLKLSAPLKEKVRAPIVFEETANTAITTNEIEIPSYSALAGKTIANADIPPSTRILIIRRNKEFIVPQGNSILNVGDELMVAGPHKEIEMLTSLVHATTEVTL